MKRAFALLVLPLSSGLMVGSAEAPTNVFVSANRTEPVVAVDAGHPSTIVLGANTNYSAPVAGTYPVAYFTSHNGGKTFVGAPVPVRPPYTTAADSSVSISRSGRVYFTYLGETPSYCSGGQSAVALTTSTDGGRSFRSPTIVDTSSADDKPYMAVRSGRPDEVFVTWNRDYQKGAAIWYSRSTNGGRTFARPVELYRSALDSYGSLPLIGTHHRVYVFWSVFPEYGLSAPMPMRIFMRASADDGIHFGPVRSVAGTFTGVPRVVQPDSLRTLTMPAGAVSHDGAISLAWPAVARNRGGGVVDVDVELIRSTTQGRSWSTAVRVNDVRSGDRFMPSMTPFPDGSVGLVFYDRRNGRWRLDVYAARVSFQRGIHVSRNVRVNRNTAPVSDIYYLAPGSTCFSPGRFFGDYIGAAAIGKSALAVTWADTQLRRASETDIWFARVKF